MKFIEQQKSAQKIWSYDLVKKEPFGYRVAYSGYFLTSCPGQLVTLKKTKL